MTSRNRGVFVMCIPEVWEAVRNRKGEPGPLIFKRGGCHIWKPEEFTEDDPRYGWTWDHCRQDAIALLGSEQALEEYIRQQSGSETAVSENVEGANLSTPASGTERQKRLF